MENVYIIRTNFERVLTVTAFSKADAENKTAGCFAPDELILTVELI